MSLFHTIRFSTSPRGRSYPNRRGLWRDRVVSVSSDKLIHPAESQNLVREKRLGELGADSPTEISTQRLDHLGDFASRKLALVRSDGDHFLVDLVGDVNAEAGDEVHPQVGAEIVDDA